MGSLPGGAWKRETMVEAREVCARGALWIVVVGSGGWRVVERGNGRQTIWLLFFSGKARINLSVVRTSLRRPNIFERYAMGFPGF